MLLVLSDNKNMAKRLNFISKDGFILYPPSSQPGAIGQTIMVVSSIIWVFGLTALLILQALLETNPESNLFVNIFQLVSRLYILVVIIGYITYKIDRKHFNEQFSEAIQRWTKTRYNLNVSHVEALTLAEVFSTKPYQSKTLQKWFVDGNGNKYIKQLGITQKDGNISLFSYSDGEEFYADFSPIS